MKNVGERVRMLRAALRLSQTEFALRCSIARSTLTRIENDHAEASAAIQAAMAGGLGLPIETLARYLDGALTLSMVVESIHHKTNSDAAQRTEARTPWDLSPEKFDQFVRQFPNDYALTVGFLIAYGAPPRLAETVGIALSARVKFTDDGEPDERSVQRMRVWASILTEAKNDGDLSPDMIGRLTDKILESSGGSVAARTR